MVYRYVLAHIVASGFSASHSVIPSTHRIGLGSRKYQDGGLVTQQPMTLVQFTGFELFLARWQWAFQIAFVGASVIWSILPIALLTFYLPDGPLQLLVLPSIVALWFTAYRISRRTGFYTKGRPTKLGSAGRRFLVYGYTLPGFILLFPMGIIVLGALVLLVFGVAGVAGAAQSATEAVTEYPE